MASVTPHSHSAPDLYQHILCYYLTLPPELLHHPAYALQTLKHLVQCGLSFRIKDIWQHFPDSVQVDETVCHCALSADGEILRHLGEPFKRNKETVLLALTDGNFKDIFDVCDMLLLDDKNFVLKALTLGASPFSRISDRLRNNSDVVKEALQYSDDLGSICRHVSQSLIHDKEFVSWMLRSGYNVYSYLPYELRNNNKLLHQAVVHHPEALRHASNRILRTRELVRLVVRKNGDCFQYVPSKWQATPQFLMEAMSGPKKMPLQYATPNLQDDLSMVMLAVRHNPAQLQFASERLRANEEVVFEATRESVAVLQFASDELRDNFSFMVKILGRDPTAYLYASYGLRHNEEFALAALKNSTSQKQCLYSFFPKFLQTHPEILQKSLRLWPSVLQQQHVLQKSL